ncbi:ATP-binding protein [Jeotgalicoccus sp. WY2]|uniref:ATP-binding protein n=1 Tax=Jeotgalicoccus sp. WY2 TaxID=2708346 RepID=UPI001BD2E4E1|nr:HAMP domain-containing sensor histidine kinase [Jeotgalicoccus sp. WY2]
MKILAATYLEAVKENKDLIGELQLLRAMAGTGLTISTFAHELKNMSAQLVSRNDNLKEILKPLIKEEQLTTLRKFQNPYIIIEDMKLQDEKLKSWLDISLETIKKDKRSRKKTDLFTVLNDLEELWRPVMESQGTTIKVPEPLDRQCIFRLFTVDFDSIFNNLISNSTAAFKRRDAMKKREIIIDLKEEDKNIVITYEDSGPGLPEGIKDPNIIFEPLFTTKLDKEGKEVGTGLGMWIVKSTVEEYSGKINISKSRPNFKVEILLPLKYGEGIINNNV